jgi:hypothetical protein
MSAKQLTKTASWKDLVNAHYHAETGTRCLARQLKAMSRLKTAQHRTIAEELFRTMLKTHDLLIGDENRIEQEFGVEQPIPKSKMPNANKHEPTSALSRNRLAPSA